MFGRGEGGGNGHVRIVFQVKTLVHQISMGFFTIRTHFVNYFMLGLGEGERGGVQT